MKKIREKSMDMLCDFGKFGVGKSLILGLYDFEVPIELLECRKRCESRNSKDSIREL